MRNGSMEDSLRKELEEVDSQLICVEQELEILLERQQELQERRQLLKAQLDSIENVRYKEEKSQLEATDWEQGFFPWTENVKSTLKSFFKLESFRPLQPSCINATLSNKDAILIMPTGGGKSLCYQLPAVISSGITLVISPLVSLMEDQLIQVKSLGIESCMLNASSSKEDVNRVHTAMTDKKGMLKLLYVTPEKLAKSKRFMSKLEKTYEMGRLSRIVIDEVHCASQWGHDFRPDYKILGILKRQFPNTPILGLTATATAKVLADCQEILSLKQCLIFRASYNRPNLFYEIRPKPTSHKAQMDELSRLMKTRFKNQCGIVYCFSRKDTEQVCLDLCQHGIKAGFYHGDLLASDRTRVHTQWLNNTLQVIVATVAFGMGIDKPDVRFVIHHSISKSMENYYQESGRAGRDGNPAYCIVLYRANDAFRQSTKVFTEHTGLQNLYTMLRYCLNESQCRRSLIARSFGEKWKPQDCQVACDICKRQSGKSGVATQATSGEVRQEDVSDCCKAMIGIIEKAQAKEQRLTALKVVDALRGQGGSVEKGERILIHAILEEVLKEEFHFTPYSTISYIGLGRKAVGVKKGLLKVTIRSTQPQEASSLPQPKPKKRTPPSSGAGLTKELKRASTKGKGKEKRSMAVVGPDCLSSSSECVDLNYELGAPSLDDSFEISDSDCEVARRKRKRPPTITDSDDEFVPSSIKPKSKKTKSVISPKKLNHMVIELDSD